MKLLSVFIAGVLFSLGLLISGMVNPAKVLGFLDVFGSWDASLAFVMGGAVVVTFFGYRVLKKQDKPLFATAFAWPSRNDIDSPLLGGAALFGIGWGLVGLCPGPAFAALTTVPKDVVLFFIPMIFGMFLARKLAQSNTTKSN